ncbi:hypothetical protein CBR64_20855 [Cellulosimicrobium cellulans]|uniref:DUF732 domain-containing protein n=1 Tax=Cellulosimicrobium cellulans TaxID=1710 RepID=A0A1Y0HZT2_CELCE|nr:hypothetical protein [Cellulosimicrobium cellulans]ARU50143.1 hypothetical protein CBR64_00050 [Cellulosimicrobium cellulans]ARU53509.1 hypothetical protein CBR64_20855 [Cellulosimicrobium cellulans]
MTTDTRRPVAHPILLVVAAVLAVVALVGAGYAWGSRASAGEQASERPAFDYEPTAKGTPQGSGIEQGSPAHHLEIVCLGLGMAILSGESSTSWDNGFEVTTMTTPAAREFVETYCPEYTFQ